MLARAPPDTHTAQHTHACMAFPPKKKQKEEETRSKHETNLPNQREMALINMTVLVNTFSAVCLIFPYRPSSTHQPVVHRVQLPFVHGLAAEPPSVSHPVRGSMFRPLGGYYLDLKRARGGGGRGRAPQLRVGSSRLCCCSLSPGVCSWGGVTGGRLLYTFSSLWKLNTEC